jgi:hypothetical protein
MHSISDAFLEKYVAMCLLMLSRDKLTKGKEKFNQLEVDKSVDE